MDEAIEKAWRISGLETATRVTITDAAIDKINPCASYAEADEIRKMLASVLAELGFEVVE